MDAEPQAVFFATDQLRPEAAATIRDLHGLGIRSLMLTGDTRASADVIAREVGITEVRAGLLPGGKLEAIREFQSQHHRIGMAGDGINDAAALAQSDAGFAMAAAPISPAKPGMFFCSTPTLPSSPKPFASAAERFA